MNWALPLHRPAQLLSSPGFVRARWGGHYDMPLDDLTARKPWQETAPLVVVTRGSWLVLSASVHKKSPSILDRKESKPGMGDNDTVFPCYTGSVKSGLFRPV
ncbi:hypothetical protein BDZ91DRAFT_208739 [Kalaharituber pfeilii]|nr:hypothetical protein BDZ91DRAFT_208739 [Kalaharituber pfeilii]